jgi:6-phospho-beta-glucosidase
MITEAVIKHFGWEKCIGLCNVPTISIKSEFQAIGRKQNEMNYRFAGLNHFHWHRVFDNDGIELTEELIEHINEDNGGTPANIFKAEFSMDLLKSMKLIPCGYHRYYYMKKEMLEHSIKEFKKFGTRAEKMKKIEGNLFEIYKNPKLAEKPQELSERGGAYYSDAACECINAIYNNSNIQMVVSTENKGAIACLPSDSIVEISSVISAKGAEPIAWGNMKSPEKGWLQMMKAMEECTIDAALTGDYGMALEAFTLNPLVENSDDTKKVLNELLVAHEEYLPQFKRTIEVLKKDGIEVKDKIVNNLIKNPKNSL